MGTKDVMTLANELTETWREEDPEKRAVIVITIRERGSAEEDLGSESYLGVSGSTNLLVKAIKGAMKQNDQMLAKLIRIAARELAHEAILEKMTDRLNKEFAED